MKGKTILILTAAMLLAGCASVKMGKTTFSFALVDFDLRDKDQIAAANGTVVVAQPKGASNLWDIITGLIGEIKGRVRVLSLDAKSESGASATDSLSAGPPATNSVPVRQPKGLRVVGGGL
jgi:hypothetical protein